MKLLKLCLLAFLFWSANTLTAKVPNQINYQTTDSTLSVKMKVKGVTCAMDLKTISNNVEKLKGVSSCVAGKQGATTSFEVKYNPTLISEKEIIAAIENTSGCEDPNDRPYKVKK